MAVLHKLSCTLKKRAMDMHFLQFRFSLSGVRKSVPRLYLIAIALTTSCLSFSALSADDIIATGDYETGDLSQWLGVFDSGTAKVEIVTSPVRQGKYAAKFFVDDGSRHNDTSGERAEVSTLEKLWPRNGDYDKRESNGDEYYYAWSTFFPEDLPLVDYWNPVFMNWHSEHGGTRAPLQLRVDVETMDINAQTSGGTCSDRDCGDRVRNNTIVKNTKKGVWNDFVVHAKWSCSSNGLIEVWHKYANEEEYEKVLSIQNVTTLQSSDYWGSCMQVYKKQGFYRSAYADGTQTIYHDGFTQGTTFEAVTRHAHGTASAQNETSLPPPLNLEIIDIAGEDVNLTSGGIPQSGWRLVYVDSEEGNRGVQAFDGDPTTHWHTEYRDSQPPPPHEIQIDLGKTYRIDGFRYLPRQDGGDNGRIKDYAFYVSSDGSDWSSVASGTFPDSAAEQEVVLSAPVTGQFIRLEALNEVNGNPWTSVAELKVVGDSL